LSPLKQELLKQLELLQDVLAMYSKVSRSKDFSKQVQDYATSRTAAVSDDRKKLLAQLGKLKE
jgi:hypothetical protein